MEVEIHTYHYDHSGRIQNKWSPAKLIKQRADGRYVVEYNGMVINKKAHDVKINQSPYGGTGRHA